MKDLNSFGVSVVNSVVKYAVNWFFPNFAWVSILGLYAAYYDLSTTGTSPTWQNVAAGSMAMAGTLGGLAFKMFLDKMRLLQKELHDDRVKRDIQHKANVAAIVSLSMTTMDKVTGEEKEQIKEMVNRLLKSDAED